MDDPIRAAVAGRCLTARRKEMQIMLPITCPYASICQQPPCPMKFGEKINNHVSIRTITFYAPFALF